MDFLAENNVCGQTLLRLVARGNSIIAELKRLAAVIPPVFKLKSRSEQQIYGEVLVDFAFFQNPETFTKKIENSESLSSCDNGIRERHLSVLCRVYAVFESIHRYAAHLNTFLSELSDGSFLHTSTDMVFADHDGKQLMCESLYLYGVMLLLLDRLYPGPTRERLIVAYHRHAGMADRPAAGDTNVDDVCQLLRSTGPKTAAKRPQGYPEDYFKRIELPSGFRDQVVGHLRTDDIYNQVSVYPSPEHRAAAFSNQAAMLYVCLYFTPQVLHSQTHKMREIVDRFFPDNWVVSYYMGSTVNLIEAWEPYKAAKQALNNTLEASNVRQVAASQAIKLKTLTQQSMQLESQGALTEAKVLGSSGSLFRLLRECNVTLRWLVLHCAALDEAGGASNKRCRAARDVVVAEVHYTPDAVFALLLHTAGLELKVTQIYKKILQEKSSRWQEQQDIAHARLLELAEVFGSEASSRPLARVRPNARLHQWFTDTAMQVTSIDIEEDHQATARKIVQMMNALNQVKEYHDLSSCGGAVQAVEEAVAALQALVRLANAEDSDMVILATVADLSYAWTLVDQYTSVMQKSIKQDAGEVVRLRAVFLKLSSGLELPLLRITQARSQDVMSVSSFYSRQLVAYIRRVLQIIPETMFSLLGSIVELQTNHLNDLPTRLDKDKIKDFAQLPQRYKLCSLCHSVGVLAEGVRQMGLTLVGVLELQPRQLLEDGVRRELVHRVATIIDKNIRFTAKKGSGSSELMERLSEVARLLRGFRSSFEYIQDYINLYALKIWHEELTRIIAANVQQECSQLLPGLASSENEDSCAVPIPFFPDTDGHSTFVGRLAAEMLRLTDPKTSTYAMVRGAWYDNTRQHNQLLDASLLLAKMEEAITIAGLAGLDKLLACTTVTTLRELLRLLESACSIEPALMELLPVIAAQLTPNTAIIGDPEKQYSAWLSYTARLCSPAIVDCLQRIGQLQLLRLHAAHRLDAACSFQANYLHQALQALNISLLNDVREHDDASPAAGERQHPDPSPDNPLTTQLTALLEWTGLSNPLHRIYVTPSQDLVRILPHVLLFIIISLLPKLQYLPKLGSLVCVKASDGLDGSCVCVGVVTVLKQLPVASSTACLSLLAQYIASHTAHASKNSSSSEVAAVHQDAITATTMLQQLAQLLPLSPQQLHALLPGGLATTHRA
uniref:Strumpellin n=1 Tax=Hirondellea gigas TaxID=1518452 RepID=A0A6A7FVW9_9CRUS